MNIPRISASSYSNTAPLIWSFLYGAQHGKVEIILDNAPARSAELLASGSVDAALVPVIVYQTLDDARLIPNVCVGAKERVQSVCLVTRDRDLCDVRSVSLDISSRTSVFLTKIIFREFLDIEPEYRNAAPDVEQMLADTDAALIIGDPALSIAKGGSADIKPDGLRSFDLAGLWHQYTGLGFVFAMWMTRAETCPIDFARARDEGLAHIDDIVANYADQIGLNREEMVAYLTHSISYEPDGSMRQGMDLYFDLAFKHALIKTDRPIDYI
jgi:chorismate dehydratase